MDDNAPQMLTARAPRIRAGQALKANSATLDRIQKLAALSVVANATNATATATEVAAASDGQVLRRSGTALGFGAVDLASAGAITGTLPVANGGTGLATITSGALMTGAGAGSVVPVGPGTTGQIPISNGATIAMTTMGTDATITSAGALTIANNAVTLAKMADIATDRLIGRDTAGTGDPETITVSGGLEWTGTGGIQRSALTGDVTATAGSNATTIAANAVTDAKFRQSAGLSVVGRASNTTGNVADITSTFDNQVFLRNGTSLVFGTVATAGITNNAVDNTKLRDSTSCSIIGRTGNTPGDPADIAASNGYFLGRRNDQLTFLYPNVYLSKSADYTVIASDSAGVVNMSASGAARTVTLTAAATLGSGFVITVKKSDSSTNTVTIDPNASETIDGDTTLVLRAQYQSVTLMCDGSNWLIVNWGVAQGTWSPVLSGGTTPGTPTYSTQLGRYQLVGKVCNYWIRLVTSGLSTAAGTVNISLPFTAQTVTSFNWVGASGCGNVNLNTGGAYYNCTPIIASAGTTLILYQVGDNNGQAALTIADLSATTDFILMGSYQVT